MIICVSYLFEAQTQNHVSASQKFELIFLINLKHMYEYFLLTSLIKNLIPPSKIVTTHKKGDDDLLERA